MEAIDKVLNSLPAQSGVYIMLDEFENILYVGKAKNLRNRVRQYFQSNLNSQKTMVLVSKIQDIRYIVTPSEADALILENNMIKEHQPPYNILLKDDKTYPYIKINVKEDFPALEVTRKLKPDGARYFGPYMLGLSAMEIIKLLEAAFPIRACRSTNLKRRKRECLNYHIGRCLAPCVGRVSVEEYKKVIDKVIRFLSGHDNEVRESLRQKMLDSAERQEFEMAMQYKEQLEILDKLVRKQTMPFKLNLDLDIFSFATNGMLAAVNISAVRGGKLIASQNTSLNDTSKENALSSFIMQYYEKNPILCSEIVVSEELEFQTELNDYLRHKADRNINIIHPIGGIRSQLVDISLANAKEYLQRQEQMLLRKEDLTKGAMTQLYQLLNLKRPPRRIECYDISNISGTNKVASMAVFIDGEKATKHYRHFRIRTVSGTNDFASMQEALERRFIRLKENDKDISFSKKPDLIVVDGGKGQLSSALLAAERTQAEVEIISLAKREEEVFVSGQKDSIILPRDSLALRLLTRIRDEAHRFAISHHRKLRLKQQTMSRLKSIKGIGEQKSKALIMHFRNIDNIRKATREELQKVKGITAELADSIVDYFTNKKEQDSIIKEQK